MGVLGLRGATGSRRDQDSAPETLAFLFAPIYEYIFIPLFFFFSLGCQHLLKVTSKS